MKTKQEKVESVKKLMNERAKENEWDLDLTADQIINKIDSLSKKAKKTYDKFRKTTATGSPVEDPFDLQAAYKEWANFQAPLFPKIQLANRGRDGHSKTFLPGAKIKAQEAKPGWFNSSPTTTLPTQRFDENPFLEIGFDHGFGVSSNTRL